ncbi:uncharacterized protein LOC121736469 [Aricia agestis]|uniref:uncharacterized protein LOC121736469 n=1 Tax=Aricia agestis TaxID=91739 RepID=UPI001C209FF4|nr:uncharacterized protein LOC121736469 [Aricia agestis]
MEGDVEDMTIIKELYGGVTIINDASRKKQEHAYRDKASAKIKKLNAGTITDNTNENSYMKKILQVPRYMTYRAQINLTAVKPTLQECGYINGMSKDTRYFAQTLRKYPLPKPQTKSSDLIQEKIRRSENRSVYRKSASKKRNVRKTASHQAIKTNVVVEYNVRDTQRFSKVEEILPTTTIDENSGNAVHIEYNYLNSKTKQSNVDVRYCTSTKRACTCRRMNNVVCTRPENCPYVRHRLDHHRQFYHNQEDGKKPSCHCNVCQASREAPSTSGLTPSKYVRENRKEQEEEVQVSSRNYLESSHHAIDFEKEIRQWTETKLQKDNVVPIKLIQKLAKALGNVSKDEGLLPEARQEVVKYLTALSIIDPIIKDKLGLLADDFLNNLSKSLKSRRSLMNIQANTQSNVEKSHIIHNNNGNETKMFIKRLLNQLTIQKDYEKLDTVVEKFLKILQEHNINVIDIRGSPNPGQYEEKNYYLNRIISWYKSIPELEQKLQVPNYDSIKHFQDLANKLSELNRSTDLKENTEKVKVELIQWLKAYLTLHNISYTESLQENLNDKLITKLFQQPTEKKMHYEGISEKDWITKEIYSLLKEMNHEIHQNKDVPELVNSLIFRLSYLKDKNCGNLTLHQCKNELKSWLKYLEDKHIVYFNENEKLELECKILSRIKVLLEHEKHVNCCHLKRLRLLTKIIFEEINRSVTNNSICISQEKLLNLISDIISLVFETQVSENPSSKSIIDKFCTILLSILNLPADDVKDLVQSILDKIVEKNLSENIKEINKLKSDGFQPKHPSKKVYKSQFVTSTPIPSEEGFLSNLNGDSTNFGQLLNKNLLRKIIQDWFEENKLKLNELEMQNIIKVITSDIIYRYNYAKAFSKSRSDLEESENLKYFIFKFLEDYVEKQEINSNIMISNESDLYDTVNKIHTPHEISEEKSKSKVDNDQNEVSLEVLKSKLVNAFINLNSYLLDERFKNEYKGKLKEEINKFCSQYFKRFPSMPIDSKQLHSNIYNALDNVPKPLQTKSEIDIVTEIKKWLDELCKESNIPNNDNENIALELANPIVQKKKAQSIMYDDENELSKMISQWVQNYSKKQKTLLDGEYWTGKLEEKLKALENFKANLSKATSAHNMYTIPEAESFGAQVDESVMQSNNSSKILAKDLLSPEDRELLTVIRDRSSPDNIVKSQIDLRSDNPEQELLRNVRPSKPDHELVPDAYPNKLEEDLVLHIRPNKPDQELVLDVRSHKSDQELVPDVRPNKPEQELLPNVHVREYHWESNEQTQTSKTFVNEPLGGLEEMAPVRLQPQGLDHEAQTTFADFKNNNTKDVTNERITPEKLKKTKRKTCKLRKRPSARCIESPKVVCPNRYTLKSKGFDKDVMCSCSDCVINKRRIKYFCKKSENMELENCPECFGGYCPFPSCAYFD